MPRAPSKPTRPSKIKVDLQMSGAFETANSLRDMGLAAYKTRPLMERILILLQKQQAARFRSKPWQELARSTKDRKLRENESPEVFEDEWRRIRGQPTRAGGAVAYGVTSANFPHQIKHVTRASASFGLDSKGHNYFFYARFAQHPKNGPTRKILAISGADTAVIIEEITKYIFDSWTVIGGKKL